MYLCSLIKFMHGGNHNLMIIARVPGNVLHSLTFWTAKQNFSVENERDLKVFSS
jgi:hypothetical protein